MQTANGSMLISVQVPPFKHWTEAHLDGAAVVVVVVVIGVSHRSPENCGTQPHTGCSTHTVVVVVGATVVVTGMQIGAAVVVVGALVVVVEVEALLVVDVVVEPILALLGAVAAELAWLAGM